jgi:hypothetical protein
MEEFDAYNEVFATIEEFVSRYSILPTSIAVAPTLYSFLAEAEREQSFLLGQAAESPLQIVTSSGTVQVIIDEALGSFEIIAVR